MTVPFRVFAGWDRRQAEAAEVFKFSVEQNASIPVRVTFISTDPAPAGLEALFEEHSITRRGVTAFSMVRFAVPWICDYEGVAFFGDAADQLCLGDVAELATMDMGDHAVMVVKHPSIRRVPRMTRARSWSSGMLLDCSKFGWLTPHVVSTASDSDLMRFAHLSDAEIGDLPEAWNTLVQPGSEPPEGAKIAHWSALSDPNGNSWIERSGSKVWEGWRQRWREARP